MNNSQGPDLLWEVKGYLGCSPEIHAKPALGALTDRSPAEGLGMLWAAGGWLQGDTCLLAQLVSGVLFSAADSSPTPTLSSHWAPRGVQLVHSVSEQLTQKSLAAHHCKVFRQLKLKVQSPTWNGQVPGCGVRKTQGHLVLPPLQCPALPGSQLSCLSGCAFLGGPESTLSHPHYYHLLPLDQKPRSAGWLVRAEVRTGQKQLN